MLQQRFSNTASWLPLSRARRFSPLSLTAIRFNSSYQPPTPVKAGNPHRNFWRSFGRPIAKVFLIALCTYQAFYWSWLKLESMEVKQNKDSEIQELEGRLEASRKPT